MKEALRVRLYNVRFGDAILVTVPDRDPVTGTTEARHLLIDFGNVLQGDGGIDSVFKPVVDNVLAELAGKPLDLYIMTHEHLDHVQGLYYAATHSYPALKDRLQTRYAWLTASAKPDYYDRHPEAQKKKHAMKACFDQIERYLNAEGNEERGHFASLLANNNPRNTAQCVDFLRGLAETTSYLSRGANLTGTHPFREASFCIWGPEEDTSNYYSLLQPMALHLEAAHAGGSSGSGREREVTPMPPPGVDAGAFYNLVARRRNCFAGNLLSIDQAANNSSLVFSLEWRGWRLLFPGDAEVGSWEMMRRAEDVLKPVHFLKVSHHGSQNGTPTGEAFDAILPPIPPDERPRRAAISAWHETYSGIPHSPTNERLKGRAELVSILDQPDKPWLDVTFEDVQYGG